MFQAQELTLFQMLFCLVPQKIGIQGNILPEMNNLVALMSKCEPEFYGLFFKWKCFERNGYFEPLLSCSL